MAPSLVTKTMRRIFLIFLLGLAFTVLGYWSAIILGSRPPAAHHNSYVWVSRIGFAIFFLGIILHPLAAVALTKLFPAKRTLFIGIAIMIVSIVVWKQIPSGVKGPNWESGLTEITLLSLLCGFMVFLNGTTRWSFQAFSRQGRRS